MKNIKLIGVTPFEKPDVRLALALAKANVFPVIHLGRDRGKAISAIKEITDKSERHFGVCFASDECTGIHLPAQVTLAIAPYGLEIEQNEHIRVVCQVHSAEEAKKARKEGAETLIVKGNEGAGKTGDESTFILFQRIVQELPGVEIWVQGGLGIHTSAAMTAMGATGLVFDSQLALFPECSAPEPVKQLCKKLNGNETKVIDSYRVLIHPLSPALPSGARMKDLEKHLGSFDLEKGYLPLGQDIAIAADLSKQYGKLGRFATGIREALYGHLRQAKAMNILRKDTPLAQELNITYPIAQGPMTRVSDVPGFAEAVASAGALPFIALSLMKGERARQLIRDTKRLVRDKTWGVGILGFAPQELREEQLRYIKEEKPPAVLIAGGRPSQTTSLEELGIKAFLHVPSVSLLDMFIKEGAKRFVFEGRECGGHVGPLSSMVLWEKQVERLLQEENADQFHIFFAGGIHDAASAAFIAAMTAPLAAKGAKIGVLMGTAYIYTKEAVATGAILPQFQELALSGKGTVLLETAPGHETRCLNSPYVDYFNKEKAKLRAEGSDKKKLWASLEQLNVGRLRIAAKGIERNGNDLVHISAEEQRGSGMYMIGQVAGMKNRVVSVGDLHKEVAEGNFGHLQKASLPAPQAQKKSALDIAIVGMACIYPEARNIDEYWRNIVLGKDCIKEVPDERWNKELYFDPGSANGNKTPSKWGGFIPETDFDPLEFGIPPQSLPAIEPAQLLSLLVARQALENAGYGDGDLNRENISVIIGAEGGNDLANNYSFRCFFRQVFGEMPREVDDALPSMTEDSFPGVLANVIAGRISNRLDLGGRNYTVDAACASSLAAIDLACQELILEKSDMVLAGGTDLHNSISDYLMFSSTHALSRKGKCMTFDAGADGIALGEGVAMVVLKKYEDARQDGDKIYAVIKGVGGSSDGKSLGLTAPRKAGQVRALERAYEQAGMPPSMAGLIEAHGTGTVVGDKTELSALTHMMTRSGAIAGQVQLGSVKTQIGHTKCAAGLAGLIKAALSVYHGVKPPTINLRTPNSYYNKETSPFSFNTEAGIWTDENRVAGISAFGFGGTNFHAVITSDTPADEKIPVLRSWPAELLVFRGDTYEEVLPQLKNIKSIVENNNAINLSDIAYSLFLHNTKPVQLSIIAGSVEDLLMKLDLSLSGVEAEGIYVTKKVEGKVAFLFPGQGSQRVNMARSLFVAFPAMRKLLKNREQYEKILFPDAVFDEGSLKEQREQIRDTRFAQPLLGIVDLALASFLRELGMEPDMVAGHSYGELPALCFAGVFGEEELVPLSEKRAKAILDAIREDKGAMLAVNCGEEELKGILADETAVFPVNHNSPRQWVLAGASDAIGRFAGRLKKSKISFRELEVACAFHSPLLARSGDLYLEAIREVPFQRPAVPVWSNTSAEIYPDDPGKIKERLAEHLIKPVRFAEEIQQMYAEGARVFIEVGPGKVLSGLVKAIIEKKEAVILHTDDKNQPGISGLLHAFAVYIASGRMMHLDKLYKDRDARILNLDEPEHYKKSGTTWLVNGQISVPLSGKLPVHGALPIVTPLQLKINNSMATPSAYTNGTAINEQTMQEYLDNMRRLVQAQRDVMLGYMGYPPQQAANGFSLPELPPAQDQLSANQRRFPVNQDQFEASAPRLQPVPPAISSNGRKEDGQVLTAVAAPGSAKKRSEAEIKAILLSTVSEKTGYPEDMLGMDMDMEAELGIDSIKRMEIIGELRTRFDELGAQGEQSDEIMEQLAAIKNLNGLLGWIMKKIPQDTAAAAGDTVIGDTPGVQNSAESPPGVQAATSSGVQTSTATTSAVPDTIEKKLSRSCFELVPAELDKSCIASLSGQRFALAGNTGEAAVRIKEFLQKNGAEAHMLPENNTPGTYDGLIILDLAPLQLNIIDAFEMIKKLDPEKLKWIYTISETQQAGSFQGYPGFLKSLDKEFEHTKCRAINLTAAFSPEKIAGMLLSELTHPDTPSEVFYKSDSRQILSPVPAPLPSGQPDNLHLDKNSVVLVLGGAQGISAELTIGLSKDHPCHYLLVGRSADPRKNGHAVFSSFKTIEEIKRGLIAEGRIKQPAEIEKKASEIHKSNQILHTIASLEQNGATVSYHSLDIREQERFAAFLDTIYKEYGKIDGVIHGAGLLEDKLFRHKTADSFERVFSTKVTPLRVLASQLREDTGFVILFSSIASVYGNQGQTDYAAANSVMDCYAGELKNKLSGKVTAINWGPWKGTGMVSPSLEREYQRRGVSLIPLPAGVEVFLNELKYGNDNQVLIMAE